MRTLVVMPTYDEAENIAEALRRVRGAAPRADVLVVDDNSPDGTAELARAVAEELGQIDVLVRDRKDGLGNAYRHGFRVGMDRGYDVLIQMDADLSHDASDIPALLAGATITETIFSWPGMGRAFIQSVQPADPPLLMAYTMMLAVGVVTFQLFADILYSWLDPRIRFG